MIFMAGSIRTQMERPAHVLYLHGFASSPASSKARRFEARCAELGIGFDCPDFNQPSFETLTITRMLDQTAEALARVKAGPVAIVGSSLGGFVAVHAAKRDRSGLVDRLILMAPAFEFGGNRLRQLGEQGIDEWRRQGSIEVFHYADNQPRRVGFALYEDAAKYDAFALDLALPIQIFQGTNDDTVLPASVAAWAADRKNVELHWLNDGHQLTDSIDFILQKSLYGAPSLNM
jgi:pimeloyl-ACP methyl ester carboxylesterase